MKITYCSLLILFLLLPTWGADSISIENFKKLNPTERDEALQKAPPEQKEELKRIHIHLSLLERWGGEAEFKTEKESWISGSRGLGAFEGIFDMYSRISDIYVSTAWEALEKSGISSGQRLAAEKKLDAGRQAIRNRLPVVHALVYKMKASPEALALNKKAEQLCMELSEKYKVGTSPHHTITKDDVTVVGRQADRFFEEMKKLPTMSPEELQKEYDAFPDEKMLRGL